MIRYDVEAIVPASPDEAFAEVLDVGSWRQWVPGVLEAGYRTAGGPRTGHRAYEVRQLYGLRVESALELIELARPRRLTFAYASRRGTAGHTSFAFAPVDAGTLVRLEVETTGGPLARLIEPLGRWYYRRIDARTLGRLRRRLGG